MRHAHLLASSALAAATLVLVAPISAQPAAGGSERQASITFPNSTKWMPAPALLPPGAQIAVVDGDPGKPGIFTMRLRMPAGYTIPPHFHPTDEHVTVLEGTFKVGMGDTYDASKLTALPAGTFGMLPTGMHHYAHTDDGATIQLHGVGPWSLKYVNPKDDPRGKSKTD